MNRFLFRSVTALALSGLLLATAAGPASALVPPPATPAPPDPMDVVAPTQARASVDVRDIAAGTAAGVFTVTVTHPSPVPVLADPIDFVVVALPAGLVQAIGATGPAGWSGVVLDDGRTVEFSGGELPGAGTAPFVVTANVARPVADATGRWRALTSTDGGSNLVTALPADEGALDTMVGVLALTGLHVVDDDARVTEGQQGVEVRATVTNAGSGNLVVTTELDAGSLAVSPAADTATVPARTASDVLFTLVAGEPDTVDLSAATSAPRAAGGKATTSLTVVKQLAVAYDDLLSPDVVVPGGEPSFRVGVTTSGDVSVTLDPALSSLSFPGTGIVAGLASPTTFAVPAGDRLLSFAPTLVPLGTGGGSYTGKVHLVGTDENGKPVDLIVVVEDQVLVDIDGSAVTPVLTAPPPLVGDQAALTDGAKATFGGEVADPGAACASCTVTGAYLSQFDALGQPIGEALSVAVTVNAQGRLAGSSTIARFEPTAATVELVVTAVDAAGRSGSGTSAPVPVDNVAPVITTVRTGGPNPAAPDANRLDAIFSEPAVLLDPLGESMPIVPVDFSCEGHAVVGAELERDQRSVHLTLATPVGPDDAPGCSYRPAGQRLQDRVGLVVTDASIDGTDGIAPGAPTVEGVDGREAVDGVYATNRSSPVVTVADVAAGHHVEIFEDADSDGQIGDSDPPIGSATASGSAVAVALDDLGTNDRELTILVRATDGAGNVGVPSAHDLELDFTPPTLTAASVAVPTVTVTVSEELASGTDEARDWRVLGRDGSADMLFFVTAVAREGVTITLTIEEGYDPKVHLVAVRHAKRNETTRYADRAGNALLDATMTFTEPVT